MEKRYIEMKPEKGKCWQNKKGHKFIHTNGLEGLPLYIEDTEEAKAAFNEEYEEVKYYMAVYKM